MKLPIEFETVQRHLDKYCLPDIIGVQIKKNELYIEFNNTICMDKCIFEYNQCWVFIPLMAIDNEEIIHEKITDFADRIKELCGKRVKAFEGFVKQYQDGLALLKRLAGD